MKKTACILAVVMMCSATFAGMEGREVVLPSPLDVDYVDITGGGNSAQYPWYTSATSCRAQILYLASSIGRGGTITEFGLRNSVNNQGHFYNVTIRMCHTSVTTLVSTFATNYGGNSPQDVLTSSDLLVGSGVPGGWNVMSLGTPFIYNGTSNLLIEIVWESWGGTQVNTYRKNVTGRNGFVYTSTYTNASGTTSATEYDGRIGFQSVPTNPEITEVARDIQYPFSWENVFVSARITPPSGQSLTLEQIDYSNDRLSWTSVDEDSTRSADPDVYCFHIPPQDGGDSVHYRIHATSAVDGETYSSVVSYLVPWDRSIYEVQYGDTGIGGTKTPSPDVGKRVHVAGIVTGEVVEDRTFYIQEAAEPWRGVTAYFTSATPVAVGDSVELNGVVVEFPSGGNSALTEISPVDRMIINESGKAFDTLKLTIPEARQEAHEGVCIRTDSVKVVGASGNFAGNTTYTISDFAGAQTMPLYVTSGSNFINTPIPSGAFILVCNLGDYNLTRQLTPRYPTDITLLADVEAKEIVAPIGVLTPGQTVTPTVKVTNNDVAADAKNVKVELSIIGSTYAKEQTVNLLLAGQTQTLVFDDWVSETGVFVVQLVVSYLGDPDPSNDTLQVPLVVIGADVAADFIFAPKGMLNAGVEAVPRVRVANGDIIDAENVLVTVKIGTVYEKQQTVALPAGNELTLAFEPWMTVEGDYVVELSVSSDGDPNPDNDVLTENLRVVASGATAWTEVPKPVPAGALGKDVKDGGWLAAGQGPEDAERYLYVAKGNKTSEFYRYDTDEDTWVTLESIPADEGGKVKRPAKGCASVLEGKHIYMVKGNNTLGFWRYDIDGDSWTRLQDVPAGPEGKAVKGGGDLAYVKTHGGGPDTGYVYLLKGYRNEFYRFNTETMTWDTTLPNVPYGSTKPKYDKGSFLAFASNPGHGRYDIWAHQAKYTNVEKTYHFMYHFNVETQTWDDTLKGMPLAGMYGGKMKNKKSKDGAAGVWEDGLIYALKGGNTCQFYRYYVEGDSWEELDTIPSYGSTLKKKRVKNGGDLASTGNGMMYALKGNKTRELWRYVMPAAFSLQPAVARSGVAADGRLQNADCRMQIAPNPLNSGYATVRYSLPKAGPVVVSVLDVAGRSVLATRSPGHLITGSLPLDLRNLANGVYLVRFDSDGYTQSRKLVVQR